MNNKVEDFLDAINIGKLINKNEVAQKKDNKYIIAIIVCGIVAIVGIVSYTLYKTIAPRIQKRKLNSNKFRYDYDDDDFDDDFDLAFGSDYASDDED